MVSTTDHSPGICYEAASDIIEGDILEPWDTFDTYQDWTDNTATYPEAGSGSMLALAYLGLGVAGEAGEVADKLKKVLRDSGGVLTNEVRAALIKEIGDVLWYAARLGVELDISMSDIAARNITKLESRLEAGTLGGSGDDR